MDKSKERPTSDRLRELFHYDRETGNLYRRVGVQSTEEGLVTNKPNSNGYLPIMVDKWLLLGHRLIWCLVYKEWPVGQVDHINGDKSDNRLVNLRLATAKENRWNTPKRECMSGVKGVRKKGNRFYTQVIANNKKFTAGTFKTI